MTGNWIAATFKTDDNGNPIIATYPDGGQQSIPAAAMEAWGETSDPPTYAELSALPIAADAQAIFDAWKAAGLVN